MLDSSWHAVVCVEGAPLLDDESREDECTRRRPAIRDSNEDFGSDWASALDDSLSLISVPDPSFAVAASPRLMVPSGAVDALIAFGYIGS